MAIQYDLAQRILDTALVLAELRSWEAIRLHDIAGAMNITLDQIRECFRQSVSDRSRLHCFPKGGADGVNWCCLLSCNKGFALYLTTAVIVWVIWVIRVRIQRSFSSAVIVRKRIVSGGFLR
jgi:hypothetical protein